MKIILMLIIKFYQKFISPFLGKNCRFYPTCSCYGLEAINKHGAIKGLYLTIKRILKCNPFNDGGVDFVPDKFKF
jgi:putative membrane protein insertion efficiency factor